VTAPPGAPTTPTSMTSSSRSPSVMLRTRASPCISPGPQCSFFPRTRQRSPLCTPEPSFFSWESGKIPLAAVYCFMFNVWESQISRGNLLVVITDDARNSLHHVYPLIATFFQLNRLQFGLRLLLRPSGACRRPPSGRVCDGSSRPTQAPTVP